MSVLPIYLYGGDMLRTKAKPVDELDNSIVKLMYDMFETMHKANGIGLAATQVGRLQRVIVIDISEVEDKKDEETGEETLIASPGLPRKLVMINPQVVSEEGTSRMDEGCLSIPEVRGEIERAEKIGIMFLDANFRETRLQADGLLARVMQHEIDHLDGVLFIDRISPAGRALMKDQLRRIKKGEVETSYPVVSGSTMARHGTGGRRRSGKVEA
ncbi:MAG: peptide deformylase [Ignavibacteriales bacterium]|nr:peptide deformylase [Ignavibacteriales bacterium]